MKRYDLLITFLAIIFFVASVSALVEYESDGFSAFFNVRLDSLNRENVQIDGKRYENLSINGFLNMNKEGEPSLPVDNYLIAVPKNSEVKISIKVGHVDTISIGTILPAPIMQSEADLSPARYIPKEIYGKNCFYPSNCVLVTERFEFLETEIAKIQIAPIQYNPVTNKIIVFRNFSFDIKFNGGIENRNAPIFGNKAKILKNLVINGNDIVKNFNNNNSRVLRDEKNILIIVHDDFKPAAESLAVWQRMKGYNVTIESGIDWVVDDKNRPKALVKEKTDIVKNLVSNFYNSNGKSGYLLIMGGWWFVPNQLHFSSVWTDQHYTASSTNIVFGNMPRGRIACETLEEAMRSVRKIIQYETEPSMDPSFYNSYLTAGMFEGSHENGYSEKRFAKTAEEIFQYLKVEQGYSNGERVFNCNYTPTAEHHPTNWNNGVYANGGPLPSHLQWPTFAWDGTKGDVSRSINNGKFLALYRGHGQPTNWSAFKFHIDDIKNLSNRDKYPIVFSVTCNTGKFDRNIYNPAWDLVCFTQEFLQAEKSGAAGVLGAAQSSFSGPNDALAHALIDAIWPNPGTSCKNPFGLLSRNKIRREPIYTLGDIMLYGLARMANDWNTSDLPMQKNLVMYHYFGDPTTKIVTKVPKIIQASSSCKVEQGSKSFNVTGINCGSGMATLVNRKTGELLGRTMFTSSNTTIPISGSFLNSDMISLTLTSDGYKPFIKNLNNSVEINKTAKRIVSSRIKFVGTKIDFEILSDKRAHISLFDIRGKKVFEKALSKSHQFYSLNLKDLNISTGFYTAQLKTDYEKLSKRVTFIK